MGRALSVLLALLFLGGFGKYYLRVFLHFSDRNLFKTRSWFLNFILAIP
jgi:hypothetical protein